MARRRGLRWMLGLGTPVALAALLAAFWDWDWFVPLAEARASIALGRPVTIEHLHVELGRVVAVTAEGVRVANPADFPEDPPFAQVPRATARIDVGALLGSREVVLPGIEVDQPVVNVLARPDGSRNYAFDLAGPKGESDDPDAPAARVGGLRINGGKAKVVIPWLRADFAVGVETEDRDGQESALVAEAHGTYAGQAVDARLVGGAVLDLRDASSPWPMDLSLRNGATTLALKGTLREPLKLRGADLRVDLGGKSMADLVPLTGVPFPATPPFRLGGRLDYAADRVRLLDAEGQVGRSDVQGAITVTTAGSRPDVTADLRSRSVDLADLGAFVGNEPGGVDTPGQTPEQRRAVARGKAGPKLLPTSPINMPRLTAANVHLKYRADRIQGRKMPFDSLDAAFDIDDGTVSLHPLSFGIGQGTLAANGSLAPQEGGGVRAKLEIELRRADLSRLLGAAGAGGAGSLGGVARIEGGGRSLSDIMGRADGEATVVTVGGNVSALLVDLSGLQFGNALLSALGVPSRAKIECLIGDFALQRGTLRSRTILLDTDAHVVGGGGTLDFAKEQLDLRFRTDAKRPTIASLPTPIHIGGTLKDPAIEPELAEAGLRAGAAVGLGILFPPLALLPTVQLGVGENGECEALKASGEKRKRGQAQQAPDGGGRR